jgi:hypothetical protein
MSIRALTKAALVQKKARGERTGSVPLGRRADESGRLEADDQEGAAIECMRTLRAEGLSLREIAEELTTRGHRPRGGRWHATTIMRALQLVRD